MGSERKQTVTIKGNVNTANFNTGEQEFLGSVTFTMGMSLLSMLMHDSSLRP